MISGKTTLIGHIGYPTESFKAPLIYNPWFERNGIDAVVVPMGCKAEDYAAFLRPFFRLTNVRGALITMPHKVSTVALLDEVSTAVRDRRLVQRDPQASRRHAAGRHVRRRRLRARREAQGPAARGRDVSRRRNRRRRFRDRRIAGRGRRAVDFAARRQCGVGRGPGEPAAAALSGARGPHGVERPGRLRPRGQWHAARHEAGRPAADRRRRGSRRRRSSARW